MNSTFLPIIFFSLTIFTCLNSIAIDDFHCKVPTCRDFHYSFTNHPNQEKYDEACYDAVFTIQGIARQRGKCYDERNGTINPDCIYAVANTIRSCIKKLVGVPTAKANYLCGYTLMKYCAVHVGLERFPLKSFSHS